MLTMFRFNVNIFAFESANTVFHWSLKSRVAFSKKKPYFYSESANS